MSPSSAPVSWSELDRTSFPEWRDGIARFDAEAGNELPPPRSYPGYPRHPLPPVRRLKRFALERALAERRSVRSLSSDMPPARSLARVLHCAHGISGQDGRGPAPSAGGLQALELYAIVFAESWLPAGLYHYDRVGHFLAHIAPSAGDHRCDRDRVERDWIPALNTAAGGALVWVAIGDGERGCRKYGARGIRFLMLEAGHLMQNLCLTSHAAGLATLPLGGFYERALARAFTVPPTDHVLYAGLCGQPVKPHRVVVCKQV